MVIVKRSMQQQPRVKRWKTLILLLIISLFSLLLWGCSIKSEVLKDRLVVPIENDIKTFNPILINDAYSGIAISFTLTGLVTENAITKNLDPELAEKWEFQQDGKQLIFTLRPDLKWSDGQPLTADDVLFTFNDIVFNEKIPSGSRDVLRIGKSQTLPKVQKLDDRRISFFMSEPFAPALRTIGGIGILPKHIFAPTLTERPSDQKLQFLETWTLATPVEKLVGNGPYLIQEYRPSERIIYKPNPYYWKKGTPYIDKFVIQIVESPDTALLRFRSGDLDMYRLRGEDYQLLKRFEKRDRYKIYNAGPATGQAFIMFNLNKGRDPKTNQPFVDPIKSKWFNDVSFRRAVAYAINREAMITNLSRGLAQTQNSPISIPSPYFLPPEKGLKVYDYQPEKSKKILIQAGYKYEAEQLLDPQGNPVRFTLMAPTGGRVAMGAQIKNDLEKIGMKVDFNPVDFRIITEKLDNSKQWDATLLGFTGGSEPNSSINLWATDGDSHLFNKGPTGDEKPFVGREIADWEQKIHDLMIKGAQELDETKRKEIYAEYQQLVQEQLPLIHLTISLYLVAVRDRIENVQPSALAGSTGVTGALWNVEQLKLKS